MYKEQKEGSSVLMDIIWTALNRFFAIMICENLQDMKTGFLGENGRYIYDVKEFPKSEAGLRTVIIPQRL